MVYFKITDGNITRKFKVTPGDMTYDQLKERIASLFPDCKHIKEGCDDLHLKYRDADGDMITISTDEEFQEALSELPSEHVWMLHIHSPSSEPEPEARPTVPADFFFRPSHSMFSHPFHGGFGGFPHFGGHHHPFGGHPLMASPWMSSPWSSLDKEFNKMVSDHSKLLTALHNEEDEEETSTGAAEGATGEGAVAKPPSGELAPGYQVKNFGSWEPKTFDGPFGKGKIIGPVGYYVSWGSGADEGKEKKEEKKEEKTEESQPAAAESQPAAEEPPKEEPVKEMETEAPQ